MSEELRMTDIEFRGHRDKAFMLAQLAGGIDVDACLEEIEYADGFGVFFQPTEWMAGRDNRKQMRELFNAIRPLAKFGKSLRPTGEQEAQS